MLLSPEVKIKIKKVKKGYRRLEKVKCEMNIYNARSDIYASDSPDINIGSEPLGL